MLKRVKFWEFQKMTAESKVMENQKRTWKKSWKVKEFEELKGVQTRLLIFFSNTVFNT